MQSCHNTYHRRDDSGRRDDDDDGGRGKTLAGQAGGTKLVGRK